MQYLTNETKSLIQQEVDKLTTLIAEAVHVGLCEEMSPNDPEFSSIYEKRIEDAQEYLVAEVDGANEAEREMRDCDMDITIGDAMQAENEIRDCMSDHFKAKAEEVVQPIFDELDDRERYDGENYDECKGY